MMELKWEVFENLQGDATNNWELLCRELVRRQYASFGSFRSVKQQPGVEFHLRLDRDCGLGGSSRHWGWQCRWYTLPSGVGLGEARRKKIVHAIRITEQHLSGMTDWVLWTRRPLTPKDQEWFYAIPSKFTLHLWTEDEVKGNLVGDAVVLRATYFGELVLTKDRFARMHSESMAPIRKRWEPLLHVEVGAEELIKSVLCSPGAWPKLGESAKRIRDRIAQFQAEIRNLRDDEVDLTNAILDELRAIREHLDAVTAAVAKGSIEAVRQELDSQVEVSLKKADVSRLAIKLRTLLHPASLSVASAEWEIRNYFLLLSQVRRRLAQNFFAVVGDAGFGKTYLAAELTKSSPTAFGGILLLAKYLGRGGTLDDLAKRVSFGGDQMIQLLEAADAVGARNGQRIPVVIDGLNESENPSDWRDLLALLQEQLSRFANVVVVVTLRATIEREVLPDNDNVIYLDGFQYVRDDALRTYFEYYKIDPAGAYIPFERFSSPLFLSIFCQTVNPERKVKVGVESIPGSLSAIFEKYREGVVTRSAEAIGLARQDVEASLQRVALAIWNANSRSVDFDTLRSLVRDEPRAWARSLARLFEEEGFLSRELQPWRSSLRDGVSRTQVSTILYDALAGFAIADAILSEQGANGFKKWIAKNAERFDRSSKKVHPLAEDILGALTGLLPRRHFIQLWKVVPAKLREQALLAITELEPDRIDPESREELKLLTKRQSTVFNRLQATRAAERHPLNSQFLTDVLNSMAVSARDLHWSEWVRRNRDEIQHELEQLVRRWQSTKIRRAIDRQFAQWIMWYLTSTVRYIRDHATKALVSYGEHAPAEFFSMVINSLQVNDPYVLERMLGASYGVLMAHQIDAAELEIPLSDFLNALRDAFSSSTAVTYHWLARQYIQGIAAFAVAYVPRAIPSGLLDSNGNVLFGASHFVPASLVVQHHSGSLGGDFENYTIGRLFTDRRKYDNSHQGYADAVKEIRGRVWELGWRAAEFGAVDVNIGNSHRTREESSTTERYAKKYGWIGFYEKAGVLAAAGQLPQDLRNSRGNPIADIDPSFPELPPQLPQVMNTWVQEAPKSDLDWLRSGEIVVPESLLRSISLIGSDGPWVAVDGYLSSSSEILGRKAFGFIRGLLVPQRKLKQFISAIESEEYLGNMFIPEEPSDYLTFAGEIPWSKEFADDSEYDADMGLYRGRIGGPFNGGMVIEILSHRYAWEDYHSALNRASGISVPSKVFSRACGLRGGASDFRQYDSSNKIASISFSPPENFDSDGNILYLREDLLREYAKRQRMAFIWVVWGERNLTADGRDNQYHEVYENYGHLWRRVIPLKATGKRSGS